VTEISESEFITSGYLYNEESNTFTRWAVEVTPGSVTDTELPESPIVGDGDSDE
jgi:hypothetical protein